MKLINDYELKTDKLIREGYRVYIEKYLQRGLDIFRKRADLFLLYTALYLIAMPLGGFIIAGPLTAGFFLVAHRLERGKPVVFDDFFEGFRYFLPLLLLTIVSGFLIFIGFVLCIIPGIYLSVAYTFAIFFIIFGDIDFWESMEMSRKLTGREWFSIFGLVIVTGLINFIGALAFGVGLLFSVPITFCAYYAAFDDIVGIRA